LEPKLPTFGESLLTFSPMDLVSGRISNACPLKPDQLLRRGRYEFSNVVHTTVRERIGEVGRVVLGSQLDGVQDNRLER